MSKGTDCARSRRPVTFGQHEFGQHERPFDKNGKRTWSGFTAWRADVAIENHETSEELSRLCTSYGVRQTSCSHPG